MWAVTTDCVPDATATLAVDSVAGGGPPTMKPTSRGCRGPSSENHGNDSDLIIQLSLKHITPNATMPPKVPLAWGKLPPPFLIPCSTRSLPALVAPKATPSPSYTTARGIKSTFPPKPNRFTHHPHKPALNSTSTAALARKAHSTPLRTGLLANKKGMTAMYDTETGKRTACTVLQLDRNQVIAHKRRDKNGYWAVQIGAGQKEPKNVTKPMLGHFAGAGVAPKRWLSEFKVLDERGLSGAPVGAMVGAGWFRVGQWVDVKAVSRGMGFAGVSGPLSLSLSLRFIHPPFVTPCASCLPSASPLLFFLFLFF